MKLSIKLIGLMLSAVFLMIVSTTANNAQAVDSFDTDVGITKKQVVKSIETANLERAKQCEFINRKTIDVAHTSLIKSHSNFMWHSVRGNVKTTTASKPYVSPERTFIRYL